MVSLPLHTTETSPAALFPDHIAIYTWNADDLRYEVPAELVPGRGYWILYFDDASVEIQGTPVDNYELPDAVPGWHMIGSVAVDAEVTVLEGNVYFPFYWWNPQIMTYEATFTIEPGKGYWLLGFTPFSIYMLADYGRVIHDPRERLKEYLQFTDEQLDELETGTGTLQLTPEQVDIIRDPVEHLLTALEPLLDETRWDDVRNTFETMISTGEADMEALNQVAQELFGLEVEPGVQVITRLEKISEEPAYSEESQPLTTEQTKVTTVYMPAGTPPEVGVGDEFINYGRKIGDRKGIGEPDYGAGITIETGGLFVYTRSWASVDMGTALLGIDFYVAADNTDVTITTTMKHITATVSVGAALAGTSVATQFEDYGEYFYEVIDSPLGWDLARKVICTALSPFVPPVLLVCAVAEGGVVAIEMLDFVQLAQALVAMEATQDREVTYHAGSLDSGLYRFYIGLHARTGGAVIGYSHAAAYGQIAKIEVTQTIPQEAVHFPDPNLEAAIREAIGKPSGDIYPSDLEGLTYLNASERSISNLIGLEHCTNLIVLDLDYNQIGDISPLTNLTNLTLLYLDHNHISDISPLTNLTGLTTLWLNSNEVEDIASLSILTNLRELWVSWNQISDISPVAVLPDLTSLNLWNNQISDISPLANLTGLERLFLSDNQITDISPLAGLTNLSHLYVSDNEMSDISPLAGLTNLTSLGLGSNQISDISPLSGLTHLTGLYLHGNQIADISPLSSLINLTSLGLGSNQISDISPLANITNLAGLQLGNNDISDISPLANLASLTELWLAANYISDISPLADLTNLTHLNLGSNSITNISPLSGLTNLTELRLNSSDIADISPLSSLTNVTLLHLGWNQITNISSLSSLTHLTELRLSGNEIADISSLGSLTNLTDLELGSTEIADISPLSGLTKLTHLYLDSNQIANVSPLFTLTSLTYLYLRNNHIADISSLSSLTNLTHLTLSNNQIVDISSLSSLVNMNYLSLTDNQISDIAPLVQNEGLSAGDRVYLNRNPLSQDSKDIHIPELQARGVDVRY